MKLKELYIMQEKAMNDWAMRHGKNMLQPPTTVIFVFTVQKYQKIEEKPNSFPLFPKNRQNGHHLPLISQSRNLKHREANLVAFDVDVVSTIKVASIAEAPSIFIMQT
ncbi:MAG: hypothetical protein J5637_05380 [Prevotella sp.]|nr:hypothetical protein [Prevotella sp.]